MDISSYAQPRSWINFVPGKLGGVTFDIVQPILTIGRDKRNALPLLDPRVSRSPARLIWNYGTCKVEKLSTRSVSDDQQGVEQSSLFHRALVAVGEESAFLFEVSIPLALTSLAGMMPGLMLSSSSSSREALRYLLLMWLTLVVMLLVPGFLTCSFFKRKDAHV